MNATVSTRKRAWQLADKLFPTDYMKDERDSLRAGYPVFNTTSTDDKYTGFHISDLNTALVMLIPARTDTRYFHDFIQHRSEIRFVKGRLKFGNSKQAAPFPSMVVIFRGAGM